MNGNKNTRTLVMTALITAIVLICTLLIRIPCGPDCYIHLGDAAILIGVMMLPRKHACFAGSVGATLADLLGGFAFWAPWTFFVKLFMVIVFGLFLDKLDKQRAEGKEIHFIGGIPRTEFIGLVVVCLVGVGGYFVSEMILFGQWLGALACVGFNTAQLVLDAFVAVLVSKSLFNSSIGESANYHRPKE